MTSISEAAGTAGDNQGLGPAENPVPCDNATAQYNLDDGTFNFTVQVTDNAVRGRGHALHAAVSVC